MLQSRPSSPFSSTQLMHRELDMQEFSAKQNESAFAAAE
jgi:hypothetical protein